MIFAFYSHKLFSARKFGQRGWLLFWSDSAIHLNRRAEIRLCPSKRGVLRDWRLSRDDFVVSTPLQTKSAGGLKREKIPGRSDSDPNFATSVAKVSGFDDGTSG